MADIEASSQTDREAGQPGPSTSVLETPPGRLVILTGPLLLILVAVQQFVTLPDLLELFRKILAGVFIVGAAWLLGIVIARGRRRFLWRVRRKLVISYVFLGVVPVVLVLAFSMAAGGVVYTNLAGYLFHDGFRDLIDDVTLVAETAGAELVAGTDRAQPALDRTVATLGERYPSLSLVVLPLSGEGDGLVAGPALAVAGSWRHQPPVSSAPLWFIRKRRFAGAVMAPQTGAEDLIVRAAVITRDGRLLVVADVPVNTDVVSRLHDQTGARIRDVALDSVGGQPEAQPGPAAGGGLFRQTVARMDYTNWDTGLTARVTFDLEVSVAALLSRVFEGQTVGLTVANLLVILAVLGLLFVVVQGSALVGGVMLARSITYAVHELFVGTERVRSGDFAHRIRIDSRDQLGELADSFNKMSGSIEHLLHVQREKQRLDDELRIAREIQQSLLPVEPPTIEGLSIADLCEPAREVGGDYYDFFDLGPRQLGVLVADVAGKGTSAALYMAELKGIMIALSHQTRSPRELLIEVNRLLADHLDNRSFITMTYAVIDLGRGTLTCARAGHTPLIVVSGDDVDVIVPDGMVLGLRLPGAAERFEELLVEYRRPLRQGDVIVLYTDGVTEAMDAADELFGDEALARVVVGQRGLDAAGIRERVLREVRAFVGEAEPHDDMTLIIIKVEGVTAGGSAL